MADYTNLPHHPLSEIFPNMNEAEFALLVEDIRTNGVRVSITLHEGKILDGRHRYKAALKAGVKFSDAMFVDLPPKSDPLTYVVGANLHRRHLNESQRALVAATVANMKHGANQHNEDKGVSSAEAAKLLNVSEKSVTRARAVVAKGSPELQKLVRDGEAKLGAAEEVLEKPKEEQVPSWKKKKADKIAARKKAAADRKATAAANNPTPATPATPASQKRMNDVDETVKKWNAFDDLQKESFVSQCREAIQTTLKKIEDREAMIRPKAAA